MTNEHKEEKREKSANEMIDEELIKSVFPEHVVERLRQELHLDDDDEEERDAEL